MNLPSHFTLPMNSILTASGIYFSYTDPLPGQIFLSDIATSLGNTCRFRGQCQFYSVAEHCVLGAALANDMDLMRAFLMHDSAEAYMGDPPTPLKVMLPDFLRIEALVESAIWGRFGMLCDRDDEVKRIDLMMRKTEHNFLFPDSPGLPELRDVPFAYVDIKCWSPVEASGKFLELATNLGIEES